MGGTSVGVVTVLVGGVGAGSGGGVVGAGSVGRGVGLGSVDEAVVTSSNKVSVEVTVIGTLDDEVVASIGSGSSKGRRGEEEVGASWRREGSTKGISSAIERCVPVDEEVSPRGGDASSTRVSKDGRGTVLDVSVAITVRGGTDTRGKVRIRAMLDRQREECFILYSVP